MSIKVQQYKAPQGTKIYLVSPESLRLKLSQQNLLNGKTQCNNNSGASTGSSSSSSSSNPDLTESTSQKKNPLPKIVQERKYRKRKIETDDLGFEDEDDAASKIGTKETTTRAGRVSKVSKYFTPKTTKCTTTSTGETPAIKVKKREPASVFRCPICKKVYIGYAKLKLHFRKFPDHYNYGSTNSNSGIPTSSNSNGSSNHSSSNFSSIPSLLPLKKDGSLSSSSKIEVLNTETQTDLAFESNDGKKAGMTPQVYHSYMSSTKSQSTSTSPSSSSNGLTLLENLNSIKTSAYNFTTSATTTRLNEALVNIQSPGNMSSVLSEMCSQQDSNRTKANRNDFCISNFDNFKAGSLNGISNNNNTNNHSMDINHHDNQDLDDVGHIFDDTLRLLLHPSLATNHHTVNGNSNNNNNLCVGSGGGGMNYHTNQHQNSILLTKHVNNFPALSPSSVLRNNANSNHHHSNNEHSQQQQQHLGSSVQRKVWDVLEEKLINQGINEILLELTDVADKLAKIARDKIIPIREEEEEQLRINTTVPIVQVDSPFLSHLLDLPMGTYMFKEDAGIRQLLPPPISAELSLTGGEEVDVGKFLTPDIDLMSLPHLTNIDFAALCSNN